MTAKQWLRISIPLQGVLILWQLGTGLNFERIPWDIYKVIHVGGGVLLALLIIIHVTINWDWVQKNYRRHRSDKQ